MKKQNDCVSVRYSFIIEYYSCCAHWVIHAKTQKTNNNNEKPTKVNYIPTVENLKKGEPSLKTKNVHSILIMAFSFHSQ